MTLTVIMKLRRLKDVPYDCFSGSKKGLKTTPIVLSLQPIESRMSALIHETYPTFYCDFLQVPHTPNDKIFCHDSRLLSLSKPLVASFR